MGTNFTSGSVLGIGERKTNRGCLFKEPTVEWEKHKEVVSHNPALESSSGLPGALITRRREAYCRAIPSRGNGGAF